jgi:hypothetical protein
MLLQPRNLYLLIHISQLYPLHEQLISILLQPQSLKSPSYV